MVAKSDGICFLDTFWEAGDLMSPKARKEYFDAIIVYRYTGVEPKTLSKEVAPVWVGTKKTLDNARKHDTTRPEKYGEDYGLI